MKRILLILMFLYGNLVLAHTLNYDNVILRQWSVGKAHNSIEGSFFMLKNGEVYIEDAHHHIVHYPLSELSQADQTFALKKSAWVNNLNKTLNPKSHTSPAPVPLFDLKFWMTFLVLAALGLYIYLRAERRQLKFLVPIVSVGGIAMLFGFTNRVLHLVQSTTDPLFVDSAFAPFRPNVNTFWDSTYFYVESKGIPDHPMMAGITNWQQQVPIPQCYIGNNAWSIPLNPVVAVTPVPVNQQHFLRGAVAVAVNGVAIFNPYTNTGADAFLTGQLDNWGGHCGRADDYHYHIAPLSLYSQTAPTMPIAFALDGFAVYGATEPDGTPMATLDANHGHYGSNGVYHYHGTAGAPYMIGNMVGVVTEDSTLQIVPQAHATPVRPSLTPLPGAVITDCQPNGSNNGYTVTYTLSGQTYYVDYNWTSTGVYTYNFISPSGTTTSTYNGFFQCNVPTFVNETDSSAQTISVYPNPAHDEIAVQLNGGLQEKDVRELAIYNLTGKLIYTTEQFKRTIDLKKTSPGVYLLKIQTADGRYTQKLIVQ